jgi:UDP-N-acetylmuramyl tripeptide synthase
VVCLQLIYAGKVLKDTTLLVKDLVKVSITAAAVFQVYNPAAACAAVGAACVPLGLPVRTICQVACVYDCSYLAER